MAESKDGQGGWMDELRRRWMDREVDGQWGHLANVVRTDSGDGLERQLLAAHAHEDLLHLAQEILEVLDQRQDK